MLTYQIVKENPSPLEYHQIRIWCGLTPRLVEACALALEHSLFCVCLRTESKELIGMGRVVGDLGSHVQVVDIAVRPDFQKKGLSKVIMNEIMHFINSKVPECAFVNLFADVDYLYQKYGFRYPNAKGMYLDRNFSKTCSL